MTQMTLSMSSPIPSEASGMCAWGLGRGGGAWAVMEEGGCVNEPTTDTRQLLDLANSLL